MDRRDLAIPFLATSIGCASASYDSGSDTGDPIEHVVDAKSVGTPTWSFRTGVVRQGGE